MKDLHEELLKNIKKHLASMQDLQNNINYEWGEEDFIYRFYHQSFKVYRLQYYTEKITDLLHVCAPKVKLKIGQSTLCSTFDKIYWLGTGNKFEPHHNNAWVDRTRPILEAFWHAKYFLDKAIKYGKELDSAPMLLPSGWAALLHLYNLR